MQRANSPTESMYPWGDDRPFYGSARYYRNTFECEIRKLSIDAGFSCPNRDGRVGVGGCTFCNNDAFSPRYADRHRSISEQMAAGREFHARSWVPGAQWLVYFQAYSNTYAPVEVLRSRYEEALRGEDVAGLIIGTRPDCVDEAVLDLVAELRQQHYVAVEFGMESAFDATLQRVNRGHSWMDSVRAVELCHERGIPCGGHFIIGLPGETDEMILQTIDQINTLRLATVKFHQLQIFRGTAMERDFESHPESYRFFTPDEYVSLLAEAVRHLRPDTAVERIVSEVPPSFRHEGLGWQGLRSHHVINRLCARLEHLGTFQGELFR